MSENPHALHQSEQFTPPLTEEDYKLLVGHERTDHSWKSNEQLRSEYMTLTDKLVHRMTHGIEVQDPETGERVVKKPDVVVWLDKSARPVSWLTKEAWPQLAAEADGTIPDMPEFRYVNIDRDQWVNEVDSLAVGRMNIDTIDKSIIRSLRSIFMRPEDKKDQLGEHIDKAPTLLDGKTIMIVDEVFTTGRTLDIAEKFFKRAFPKTAVGGAYWMQGIAMKGQATGNADLPVWYKEKVEGGRGVGNREESKSRMSHSMTQRLGGWFLSTVLHDDVDGKQLRKELKMLAHDAVEHKVLFMPSLERDDVDLDERIERYNGMTIDEFVATKQAANKKS